jgi:RHS repeat-associated protein
VSGQIGTNPATTYATVTSFATTGAATSMTLGNALAETTTFNARLQPTQIQAGALMTLGYTYSATQNNGNLQTQTITRPSSSLTQTYGYDTLNRLTSANQTGSVAWSQGYGYDNYGNRWLGSYSGALPAPSLEVPTTPNAYLSGNNRIGGWNYDAAGNVLDIPATNSLRHATYDAENRMKTMSLANGDQATYDYDGDGRRVKKSVTPSGAGVITTVFVYDPMGQLTSEFGSTNDTGTRYLTADHLGSTRLITNADGSVDKTYDYLPFGEEYSPTSPIYPQLGGPNSIKFTGKERDAESGLDFFGARYMSSAQGRFTSPDAPFADQHLENPQSWNLYAYTLNNPLRFIDDTGHATRPAQTQFVNQALASDPTLRNVILKSVNFSPGGYEDAYLRGGLSNLDAGAGNTLRGLAGEATVIDQINGPNPRDVDRAYPSPTNLSGVSPDIGVQLTSGFLPAAPQIMGVANALGGLGNVTLSPTVTLSYIEVKSGLSASSIGKGVDQAVATAGAIGAAGLGSKAISVLMVDSKAWGSLNAQQRSDYVKRTTAAGAYIQVAPGLADSARKRAQKLLDETRKDQQ